MLAELHLPRNKLRPFTQVFHSGIKPQHLSANKRKEKGDVERAVGTLFFVLILRREEHQPKALG